MRKRARFPVVSAFTIVTSGAGFLVAVPALASVSASTGPDLNEIPTEPLVVGEEPSEAVAGAQTAAVAADAGVVVEALTSPAELTTAMPDGAMQYEVSSVPARVQRDEECVPISKAEQSCRGGTIGSSYKNLGVQLGDKFEVRIVG